LNWNKTYISILGWPALVIGIPNWPESHPHDYLSHTLIYRQNNMEMINHGCYALGYATHIHGRYRVHEGTGVLLMKVDDTCEEDEHERQRGWLALRETNAEDEFYERIGGINMPSSHQHTAVMEMWYKDSAKEMEVTII
jgi:hypothetical protein